MRLYVIAGHGHGDPGACAHGYSEAERVRKLANKIKELGGDSVWLGDMSRDYYADNGISSLSLPSDMAIVELHMDSAGAGARGGHVVICAGLSADHEDVKLAANISEMFPGRSRTIVARDNLANLLRAKAKGLNYRLLECCFISNYDDLTKFNNQMDEVARKILEAFGIEARSKNGWRRDNIGWWYAVDGSYYKDGWHKIDDKWYHFNESGYMSESRWIRYKEKWYYVCESGAMLENKWVKWKGAWYYLSADGVMAKEQELAIDGHTYMFTSDGQMITGWHLENEKWFYYNRSGGDIPEGAMLKNQFIFDGGKVYFVGEDGVMLSNKEMQVKFGQDGVLTI